MRNRQLVSFVTAWARRRYPLNEIFKWVAWFQGKSLHWSLFLFLALLLVGGALGYHQYRESFFYVVTVDGQEVGLVRQTEEVFQFVSALTAKCSDLHGLELQPREEIVLSLEYRPRGKPDPVAVREALRRRITPVARAAQVTVDGRPVLPVQGAEEIVTVVDLLQEAFCSAGENVRLLEFSITEEIAAVPCTVLPGQICDPGAVAELLLQGTPRREIYTVSRGDTLSGIAVRYDLAVDELKEANPQLTDILQVGDEVVLAAVTPLVHVTLVEEETMVERIPFGTSYTYSDTLWVVQSRVIVSGVPGSKQVIYRVTRENGVEIAREIMMENILEKPVTEVIEKGTARVPAYGTGSFLWPIPDSTGGGERITQGFRGYRHRGIDIAASSGTPIAAADAGVVVVSEYRWPMGNYIVIDHGRHYTLYLHNSVNLVWAGAVVQKGEVIASMGSTGRSTGPHLHFEIRISDGSGRWDSWDQHPPVNPLDFFTP